MTHDASTIRHELRTPVNHVVGYADLLLEEGELPVSLANGLADIKGVSRRILTIIPRILDADAAESSAAVGVLEALVRELETRAGLLEPGVDQQADVGRIRIAIARLTELAAAIREDQGTTPTSEKDVAAGTPDAGVPGDAPLVLVVDDDEANRNVLSRRLFRLGYRVVEAANGLEALQMMSEDGVDLVLLDVMMPVLDGYGVLERRLQNAAIRDIPVIVISALDQVESVVRCIELGAEDYLAKPFDPVLLQARVGACLEKKRLRDAERGLLETVSAQAAELKEWNDELERRVEEKAAQVEKLSLIERFVPPQLSSVLQSGAADLLKSHRREIAVLFADFRGFTPFSETAEPEDVMAVLHEFHEAVGPLVMECEGTLTQFTGDGMMVIFNDPVPCPDPAARAVRLAIGMRERCRDLFVGWERRGHDLGLGVAIAMGHATCGEIGFEGRYEYTAIGTVTNVASRLCAEARAGQLLVSSRVADSLGDTVRLEPLGTFELRGIARPVAVFNIAG